MRLARHFIIRGRVQGVGYRYYTLDHALRLGLQGFVRNLPAGDVEVHAEGDPLDLDRLRAALEAGPRYSEVVEVIEEETAVTIRYSSFEIRG